MKNKNNTILKEAYKAFRKKRFTEAIVLLEKAISHRPSDSYPYFLLCVSYLLINKFNDAERLIKKTRTVDPNYLPLIQLESFLLLKSTSNIHSVIADYIDKLDRYPNDKHIKRALGNLREVKDFNSFQKTAKLNSYVLIPKPKSSNLKKLRPLHRINEKPIKRNNYSTSPKIKYIKTILIIFSICLIFIILGISFYYFYYINPIINKEKKNSIIPTDSINIDVIQYDLIDKIIKNKPPVFYYSSDELLNDFNKAKYLIKNEKYNDAMMLINKIDNSNANFRVKERNEFLRKYILNIEYKTYSEIPVENVFQKPYLYRGMFLKWNGKITNLKRKENKTSFNLLVNYKKDDMFSGIIDVYSEKDQKDINNGDIIMLEGVLINTINNNRLYIVADEIKKQPIKN